MKDIFIFRSILKDNEAKQFQIIGIVSEIILSKECFKHNKEISSLLKEVFNVEYKMYVMRSRTMILSRTIRYIHSSSDSETDVIRRKLLKFIEKYFYSDTPHKKGKSNFSDWLK